MAEHVFLKKTDPGGRPTSRGDGGMSEHDGRKIEKQKEGRGDAQGEAPRHARRPSC